MQTQDLNNPCDREEARKHIFGLTEDLVSDFLYYNRKEDEEVGVDYIPVAITKGFITGEEIAQAFKEKLLDAID
jgi:hypothetical protein